jgi:hypothetical protein
VPTPEARREERKKFDRHKAYVYFHVGVWLVGLGIILAGAPATGVIGALSWTTQQFLGFCMLLGSCSAIVGMLIGTRVLRRDTLANPLDLRYPYGWGVGGLFGVGIAMWAYFITILTNSTVVGTLSGGLTLAFGTMSIHLGYDFAHQIVVRTKLRNSLTRREIRDRDSKGELP